MKKTTGLLFMIKHTLFSKLLLLLALTPFYFLYSQQGTIDSLKKLLNSEADDLRKIAFLDDLTWEYLYSDIDSAEKYARETMSFSEKLHDEKWIAIAHHSLGTFFFQVSEYDSAVAHFEIARDINERIGNKDKASSNYNGLGNVFLQKGLYKNALDNYLRALKLSEETGNKRKSAQITGNISLIYLNLSNFQKALEYNFKALHLAEELADSAGIAAACSNIAHLFKEVDSIETAISYDLRAIEIFQRLNMTSRLAETYNNLGVIYKTTGDFHGALKYFQKAVELNLHMNNVMGLAAAYINTGGVYLLKKEYHRAIPYLAEGLKFSKQIESRERIMTSYYSLQQAYAGLNDIDKAYRYLLLYTEIRDSLLNEENSKQMAEMQTVYETEKKQKEIELQNARIEKQAAEINKQKALNYSFGAGVVMLLAVAFLIFRGYRQKKKAHYEIEKRNLRLQKANEEIFKQKEIIEEKNKDILDSIRYAKRIQQAMLPPEKFIKEYLPDSFILYKPKDIVAGDFYWMYPLLENPGTTGSVLLAACDCTGHGVPGAFVSIVAGNALNRAVKEFGLTEPAKILDKVNELVEESFAKSENEIKDGMDIALIHLEKELPADHSSFKLQFAGANNPLWLFKNTTGEITEIKADVQPIGKYINRHSFLNHSLELRKGDSVYIFSDGYADQFGGPKGKKFKYRQFQALVKSIQDKTMEEQKIILDKTIEDWRGDLMQIDDICVIGVRV